jgi:hypothetical protein
MYTHSSSIDFRRTSPPSRAAGVSRYFSLVLRVSGVFSVIILLSVGKFLKLSEPSASRDEQNQNRKQMINHDVLFVVKCCLLKI